MTYVTKTISRF